MKSQNEQIDVNGIDAMDMDAEEARQIAYQKSLRGRLFLRAMRAVRGAADKGEYECAFVHHFKSLGQLEIEALNRLQRDLEIRGYKGDIKTKPTEGDETLCAGPVSATVEVRWHE